MQHQRARLFEPVEEMASRLETDSGNNIASFLLLLAGLIVEQHNAGESGPRETRRLGKTMTEELGECILHLIKAAGKQGFPLPVISSKVRGGRKTAIAVRYAGTSNCYWVDIADSSAETPLMYTILVKSDLLEASGSRRNDLNTAGGC